MNTTHTPAPWGFHPAMNGPMVSIVNADGKVCDFYDTVIGAGDKIIATVRGKSVSTGFPCVDSREECAANARLVAAAPDLLAALIAFRDGGPDGGQNFIGWHDAYQPAVDAARAAIAKATGE